MKNDKKRAIVEWCVLFLSLIGFLISHYTNYYLWSLFQRLAENGCKAISPHSSVIFFQWVVFEAIVIIVISIFIALNLKNLKLLTLSFIVGSVFAVNMSIWAVIVQFLKYLPIMH